MFSKRFFRRTKKRLGQVGIFLWKLLLAPFRIIFHIFGLCVRGFISAYDNGSLRKSLGGIPALLIILGFAIVMSLAMTQSRESLNLRYRRVAENAAIEKNWRLAKVASQRVLAANPNSFDDAFRLAMVCMETSDNVRANAILSRLASADRPTHADSHLWRARALLEKKTLTLAEVNELEKQLRNAISLRPSDRVSRSILAQVEAKTGKRDQAIETLLLIQPRTADDEFLLANLYLASRDVPKATSNGRNAVRLYRQQLQSDPKSLPNQLSLAKALVFIEEFQDAIEVLLPAYEADKESVARVISTIYASWSQSIDARQVFTPFHFDIILQSVKYDPTNPLAYDQLMRFVNLPEGEQLTYLRTLLKELLVAGYEPAMVHLCLGIERSFHGDEAEALNHLEISYRLDPNNYVIPNNLAWQLAFTPGGDLNRALNLCELALKQAPDSPQVIETRGQIFVKMKRWKEAIADLEFALSRNPEEVQTKEALIEAYEALEMMDIADRYKKQIKK
jgi:tetratricopeptide (TPR) repeat protein